MTIETNGQSLRVPRWFFVVVALAVGVFSAGSAFALKAAGLTAVRADLDKHLAWAESKDQSVQARLAIVEWKIDALIALSCLQSQPNLLRAARVPCQEVLPR